MNWLDFVILGVVAWFTLQAFLSGLVRETVGLVAVVGGVALAGLYHDELAKNLTIFAGDETALRVVAFLLIFGIVAILGWIAALFLRNTSEMLFLGWADRAGGAVFGFFKAVLIVQAPDRDLRAAADAGHGGRDRRLHDRGVLSGHDADRACVAAQRVRSSAARIHSLGTGGARSKRYSFARIAARDGRAPWPAVEAGAFDRRRDP